MNKKLQITSLFLVLSLSFLSGCNKSVDYEEITDLSLKEEVASFVGISSKEEYEPVPGDYTQGYSFYNSLIDGEINQNKRVYSYIYDFSINDKDKEYYLIYLDKDIVNKLNEDNSSDELIINNYFLYLYNEKITNKDISKDFKLFKVDGVEDISYSIDNYQIISVFESNEFNLKENLSTKEIINEKKQYLSTIYLEFNDNKKVSLVKENDDNYENEYLVTNYEDILSNTLVYDFAISNNLSSEYKVFEEIENYENNEVVSLKRYYFYNGETLDLLKDDLTEFSDIDYFGNYKEEFLDSYIIDLSSINPNYSSYYSYFLLDKLEEYMH